MTIDGSRRLRPTARLRAAVKAAYQAFAHYHPGTQLATCHCALCLEPGVEQRLLTTPPRRTSAKLLSEYTWALNGSDRSKLDADECRHFLPRYFHFIAYGLWPNFDGAWQPTLRALGAHDYRERWPSSEVSIIDAYFDALLERELMLPIKWVSRADDSQYAFTDVVDLLNTLAIAGASMDRLISEWGRQLNGAGLIHAACIIDDCERSWEPGLVSNDLPSAWWDDFQDQARVLRKWIYRADNAQRFQTASDSELDVKTRDLLRRSANATNRRQGFSTIACF